MEEIKKYGSWYNYKRTLSTFGAEMDKIEQKLQFFFESNSLPHEFLFDVMEHLNLFHEHPILLEENIFMLCHQYEYAHPEQLINLICGDTTLIEGDESPPPVVKRELDGFLDVSLLGLGGMGEVRRVFDADLDCYDDADADANDDAAGDAASNLRF